MSTGIRTLDELRWFAAPAREFTQTLLTGGRAAYLMVT